MQSHFKILILFFFLLPLIVNAQINQPTEGFRFSVNKDGTSSDTLLVIRLWYNDSNKLIKEEKFSTSDRGGDISIRYYDGEGKLVRKEGSFGDSSYISNVEFSRDENGEIVMQTFTGSDGKVILSHKNRYDSSGKIKESIIIPKDAPKDFDSVTILGKMEWTYDSYGRLIKLNNISLGKSISEIEFDYDEKGNKITELEKSDTTLIKYTFQNDSLNRIVVQDCYINSEFYSTTSFQRFNDTIQEEKTKYADGSFEVTFYRKKLEN